MSNEGYAKLQVDVIALQCSNEKMGWPRHGLIAICNGKMAMAVGVRHRHVVVVACMLFVCNETDHKLHCKFSRITWGHS